MGVEVKWTFAYKMKTKEIKMMNKTRMKNKTDRHTNLHHMEKLQSLVHWGGRANDATPLYVCPSDAKEQNLLVPLKKDHQSDITASQHHFKACRFFQKNSSSLQEAERRRQSAGSRWGGSGHML